ncbi:MAG: alkaline phosphatase family protein [Gemmatimonadaceae bacterium]
MRLSAGTTLLLAAISVHSSAQPSAGSRQTDLIVFVTVDQLRPDYFERFERQLSGGLGRLYRTGAVFLNGFQDHANTETAPGHASTMSGRFPRSTGIVANSAGVADPQAPLLGERASGVEGHASPYRFRGSTLIDWLRVRNPASRALSVSRKDRGAILPLGRAKQHVYWYAGYGFTTSTYYADTLATWVRQFNARRLPQRYAGQRWEPLLTEQGAYPEPDSVPTESGGRAFTFPHTFPNDSSEAAAALAGTPMMDEVTLALALAGLEALRLGATDGVTDILAVSLSATDAVGHRFGPDSREVHDQIVRLDRYLGAFMDSLLKLRDPTRVVFALTADHGVAPLPNSVSRDGNTGAGFAPIATAVTSFLTPLRERGVGTDAVAYANDMLLIDRPAVSARGINADSLARAFAAAMRAVPGVLRADLVSQLSRQDSVRDYVTRRWLHMLPPDIPAAVVVTLKPYWYSEGVNFATHGSPHDYDARVPIIFWGPTIRAARHLRAVRVVDMAPTLAALVGATPSERLDGRVLREVVP